jgi:hypothetical protein
MVMTKVLRIFALLMAASMLLWIAGCGGDDDDDDCGENVKPEVTMTPNGGQVSEGQTITLAFNKAMSSVTGTGATPTSTDNKVWTFTLTAGDGQAVTITGEDDCEETVSASGTFSVGAPDLDAPELDGGASDPPDGEDGVDPADVSEITLVFNEILASVELTNFEPDANVDAKLDGDTVTVEFLGGWTPSNEQEIVVELTVTDGSGNSADIEYGFTTMAKE